MKGGVGERDKFRCDEDLRSYLLLLYGNWKDASKDDYRVKDISVEHRENGSAP